MSKFNTMILLRKAFLDFYVGEQRQTQLGPHNVNIQSISLGQTRPLTGGKFKFVHVR